MAIISRLDVSGAQQATAYGNLPEWSWGGGGTTGYSLAASNASISGSSVHAPYSQPFTTGYDIKASTPVSSRLPYQAATNAVISDGQFQLSIFVMNVSIDIALSGSTAQARWTRDFYPHNFTQPNFTITGQSLNQGDYGKLCEFIHQAQQKAVFDGYKHLTQIKVRGGSDPRGNGVMKVYDGNRTAAPAVIDATGTYPNQIIKGTHKSIVAKGFITTISRQHQTGVVAPEWSFDFTVANMIEGPYQDDTTYSIVQGNDWVTMLKNTQAQTGTISSTPALIAANTKNLATATSKSSNIFTDPSANTPSGS
jgi:hypothetical protein